MKKIRNSLVILIFLTVSLSGCSLVDKVLNRNSSHEGHDMSSTKEQKTMYQCPMHPSYISDSPGDCPICGMKLVKIEKDPSVNSEEAKPAGAVHINVNKQQIIGINTTEVVKKATSKEIKTLGTVVPDERLIFHVHTRFPGYIDKVFADYEGKYVSAGTPLFTIYSPELVSTQEEYLLALKAEEQLAGHKYDEIDKSQQSLKEATLRRLELWEISEEEIKELAQNKTVKQHLTIDSPYSGFITKREAYEGLTISSETELYEITDLSKVWVIAEVFEPDLPYIKLGQEALINFTYETAAPLRGKITYIYPDLDEMNRTVKVRVEVLNPDLKLKPNMYVDAMISNPLGAQLIVPQSSIVDSGERQIVFVKTEDDYFIPKDVVLGAEINLKDDNYQVIKSGLAVGEKVVTDGNFLLDSESNLKSALKQLAGGHNH